MPDNKTYYLIEAYIQNRLTEAEKEELQEIVVNKESEEELVEALQKYLSSLEPDASLDKEALQHIWKNAVAVDKDSQAAKIISLGKRWRVWVAAAVVVFVVCSLWFVVSRRSQVAGDKTQVAKTNDVPAPKETRAVITLANGRKVYLDSVNNGTIAQENNVDVVKNEKGEIIYSHTSTSLSAGSGAKAQSEIVYNTLSNPRGSKVINMELSDGSHVWLNAGSSVTYPVAFIGNDRKVEITGEAYFEVTHDASKPFHVTKGETDITVLGTHFNVNAYDDEDALRVTLLEGSVSVKSEVGGQKSEKIIKPGQQARAVSGELSVVSNVDVDEVMAWKNGVFDFNSADIQTIMRQVSRWYDVDVVYEGSIPHREFTGKFSRNVNASQVMKILELSKIHFRIEGKKITVTP